MSATFNVQAGNNDEFVASLLPEAVGTYDYAYRYSTTEGRDWVYADLDGIGNACDDAFTSTECKVTGGGFITAAKQNFGFNASFSDSSTRGHSTYAWRPAATSASRDRRRSA